MGKIQVESDIRWKYRLPVQFPNFLESPYLARSLCLCLRVSFPSEKLLCSVERSRKLHCENKHAHRKLPLYMYDVRSTLYL